MFVFIDLRYAECVCLYYGLRAWSQTNKLNYITLSNIKLQEQRVLAKTRVKLAQVSDLNQFSQITTVASNVFLFS